VKHRLLKRLLLLKRLQLHQHLLHLLLPLLRLLHLMKRRLLLRLLLLH
jgi:hypothetical protein